MPIKLQKGLFIGDFPLSQLFGENPEDYAKFGLKGHNGIDYAIPTGTPLISCINGTVIECAYDAPGYGNYLKIENDKCGVIYAHMKRLSDYKPGMMVAVGANIGLSGNTGNSTGSHLHFGVFPKPRDRSNGYGGYIDPLDKTKVEWVDDINEIPESDRIKELEEILAGVRKSRDNWKIEATKLQKDKEKLQEKEIKYLESLEIKKKEVNEIRVELTRFNKDVIHLKLLRKDIQILITSIDEVPKGGVNSG